MHAGGGDIRKLLLGVPFDEGGDEVAYRFFIEPMADRPHLAVHDVIGHLRER
jgi:hypothetical protein